MQLKECIECGSVTECMSMGRTASDQGKDEREWCGKLYAKNMLGDNVDSTYGIKVGDLYQHLS